MKPLNLVIVLVTLFVKYNTCRKLPSNFLKCTYGDPNFDQCLDQALVTALSFLTEPMRKIGLPRAEPLEVASFVIGEGTGSVAVTQKFKNAEIYGLTNMKVAEIKSSLEPDMFFNITVLFPEIKVSALYSLNGKVLVLPIQGEGNATLILKNASAFVYLPFEKEHKKGDTFIKISSKGSVTLLDLDLLYMRFDNLYNGNKEMGEATNKVLNDNWRSIFEEVRSGYSKFLTEIIISIANSFFAKVPLKELFDNLPQNVLE